MTHNLSLSTHNNKFEIQDKRRKVATMLAQSMTETGIAQELKIDQSTISWMNMVCNRKRSIVILVKSVYYFYTSVYRSP
jgi:orotate phosphoribosyltransferase-like protein